MITEEMHSNNRFVKITASVLFTLIILVFVFYMGSGQLASMTGAGSNAAEVNSRIITMQDYQSAYDRMVQFYAQMFGGNFDAEAQKRFGLRQAALEELIFTELVAQNAEKSGISASKAEVADIIFNVPIFKKDGNFHREFYQQFLENRHMSASQFESELKRSILVEKQRGSFMSALAPTKGEVEKEKWIREKKMNLSFVKFDASELAKQLKADPKKVLELLSTEVGKKQVSQEFDLHRLELDQPEEVKARHILIKLNGAYAKSEGEALKKIQELETKAKTEDFGKLASQYSEDLGSKAKNGDLGFFARGRMVPEFEAAAFSLEKGKISQPIKSQFGYHLIQVLDKKAAIKADLKDHEAEIAKSIVAREMASQIKKEFEDMMAKGATSQVETKIRELGLKWEETGNFDLSTDAIPKLGASDSVLEQALSVSESKPLAAKLAQASGASVLVKYLKPQPEKVAAAVSKTKSKGGKEIPAQAPAKLDDETLKSQLASSRMQDVYSKWRDELTKTASIKKNPRLFKEE